jgi:tetratricopeptide (TPR) repeat protein
MAERGAMGRGGWGGQLTMNLRLGRQAQSLAFMLCGLAVAVVVAQGWQIRNDSDSASVSGLLEAGERKLEDGRTTLDEKTLNAAREVFEGCITQNGKSSLCFYDLARTDANLEKVKEVQKDNRAAEHWLDSAIANARRAIEIDDQSSDAHALLADLYGMKIGFGGMFAGMRYGPKANGEIQRAFQLDANNPRAYAAVGRKYLFAPKIFGGDLTRAIESFKKATVLDPHYDEAFVWLAIAYRKVGDRPQAETALSEALRLNGRSAFAKRIQSGSPL